MIIILVLIPLVEIIIHPKSVLQVDAGDSVTFTCVAYGSPVPHFLWSRNSTKLSNDSRIMISEEVVYLRGVTFVTSTMEICSTEAADTGTYTCTAGGGLHNDTFSFWVPVIAKSKNKVLLNIHGITLVPSPLRS